MSRFLVTLGFLTCFSQIVIANDIATLTPHRAVVEEVVDGRLHTEIFLIGLEKGISGGRSATATSSAHAKYIVSNLDKETIKNKFIELYIKYLSEADAIKYAQFLRTDTGKKWRQSTLIAVTLDSEGKSPEEIKNAISSILSQNDIATINLFLSSKDATRIIEAQKMVESEFLKYIQPELQRINSISHNGS